MLKLWSRLVNRGRAVRTSAGDPLDASTRDPETGLFTHRHFDERLAAEIELAEAYEEPFTLLAVGIDRYDAFRELHGDFRAAQLNALIADVLYRRMRLADVATSDGHDFLILMPETSADAAALSFRRLRHSVEDAGRAQSDESFHQFTLSAGVFEYDGSRPPEIVRAALWALERARALGGNDIQRFTPGWSDWKPAPVSFPADQPVQLRRA
jgi:diguanylate cyclase (GGDEF)-like protein